MSAGTDEVRVTTQIRRDGRVTVTAKLIGWEASDAVSLRYLTPRLTKIAERVAVSVVNAFREEGDG